MMTGSNWTGMSFALRGTLAPTGLNSTMLRSKARVLVVPGQTLFRWVSGMTVIGQYYLMDWVGISERTASRLVDALVIPSFQGGV